MIIWNVVVSVERIMYRNSNKPEPMPNNTPDNNNHPAVWDLVIQDMQERDASGQKKIQY